MIETKVFAKNYKNAENCKNCPKSDDENGCPWWWNFIATEGNSPVGQQYIHQQCGKAALPVFLHEYVRSSNGFAAAIESMRNLFAVKMDQLEALEDKANGSASKTTS